MQNAELRRQYREDVYGWEDDAPMPDPFLLIGARFAEFKRALEDLRAQPELAGDAEYFAETEAAIARGAAFAAQDLNDAFRAWQPGGFFNDRRRAH